MEYPKKEAHTENCLGKFSDFDQKCVQNVQQMRLIRFCNVMWEEGIDKSRVKLEGECDEWEKRNCNRALFSSISSLS